MMPPPPDLREALRGLCCGHGWSYAALWRPDRGDPQLLVMEECYYNEQIRTAIDKMRNQVHVVGEGTLGAAAVSGKHQWIYSDTCSIDLSPTSPGDNLDMFQGSTEWQHQFIAGIKTIAIVSLPSFGVVQFGSSQKISASLEFVDQVKSLFRQLETMMVHFLNVDAPKATDIPDPHAVFAAVISSGDAYSSNNKINSLHEDAYEVRQVNTQSSTGRIQPSSFFSLGSHNGTRSQSGSMNPHVFAMPVFSSSTGLSIGLSNSVSRNSSFHLKNQCQVAGTNARTLLSANTDVRYKSSFPDNSLANCLNANLLEMATLPMQEQRLLSDMTMQGFPNMLSTKSHFPIPHANTFHRFGGCSSESCSPYGSQGDLSTTKSSFKEPSAPELPDNFFTFPQGLTPERSTLVHYKDDPFSDLIHSSGQPLEQLTDVRTMPINDDLPSVSCVSSSLVGGDSVGCSRNKLVENSVASAGNSLDTGSNWKANSSNAPTLLLSDNDLFDGMELHLSPRILGQDSWDEILLPVGSGNCSKLSTSVSDCIDMGSIEGADKGFFSESTLEQLLDAVVAGNVNLSSSHSSVATSVNSVAGFDSEHQLSNITKAGGPQVYKNEVPLVGHPSVIRTSDMSLPEYCLEKIMEGSPKEALTKSHLSSWIDDSCSMNNESAVINQPKMPEEAAKVARKRARPGESTRPRPKDRQQIQDRFKELREIVPNGAKCSIDSLLDRTIKHMLFLQSVTKYADKLKQADEPKMIGDESGVVLKDNLNGGGGGATWAYEVSGQTMVCPILVKDLNPPGQMLVEMLCEDHGFFS